MMNTDKIISLCNQIELIIGAICNTGYTIQPGDEEAIFNRTKAIADEVNAIPESNADFIRHMTDEELADWFAQFMMCHVCVIRKTNQLGVIKMNAENMHSNT